MEAVGNIPVAHEDNSLFRDAVAPHHVIRVANISLDTIQHILVERTRKHAEHGRRGDILVERVQKCVEHGRQGDMLVQRTQTYTENGR